MDKGIITISMPKNSTHDEIKSVRNKYKDKYKVNIILSGEKSPKDIIENFLKARLDV